MSGNINIKLDESVHEGSAVSIASIAPLVNNVTENVHINVIIVNRGIHN